MTSRQKLISCTFRFVITLYIYPRIIAIFALQIYIKDILSKYISPVPPQPLVGKT
jgi:hypothetical protein